MAERDLVVENAKPDQLRIDLATGGVVRIGRGNEALVLARRERPRPRLGREATPSSAIAFFVLAAATVLLRRLARPL